MTDAGRRLATARPRQRWVVVVAFVALVLLAVGLVAPLLEVDRFLGSGRSYSVLSGGLEFLRSDRWYLGVLVLLFSVLFPVAKLLLLLGCWLWPLDERRRRTIVGWVDRLGKWSMLDVYVAVFTVGAVRLGVLADAGVRWGIYVFGAAILVSLVASLWTLRAVGPSGSTEAEGSRRTVDHLPLVTGAGVPLMLLGMALPLVEVEKWILWSETFSIFSGTVRLFGDGRPLLAAGLALFLIVIPLLHQGALFLLSADHVSGKASPDLRRTLRDVERWAMLDVFGLALFVGALGLADLASLQARAGLWCFGAALFCSAYGSFWVRRI